MTQSSVSNSVAKLSENIIALNVCFKASALGVYNIYKGILLQFCDVCDICSAKTVKKRLTLCLMVQSGMLMALCNTTVFIQKRYATA